MSVRTLQVEEVPFYGERLSGKFFHGEFHRQTACLRKSLERNKVPDKAIGCLENLLWWIDWNQNKVRTGTNSPRKETPLIYRNYCSSDQKKWFLFQIRYELVEILLKQQLAALKNHSSKIILNKNLSLPATKVSNHCKNVSPIHAYDQKSVLNSLEIDEKLPFRMKRCTTTIKPRTLLMVLHNLKFLLIWSRKLTLHQIVVKFSEKRFRSMTLCTLLMKRTSRPQ